VIIFVVRAAGMDDTSYPDASIAAPPQTEGRAGALGSRTAGGMLGLEPCH